MHVAQSRVGKKERLHACWLQRDVLASASPVGIHAVQWHSSDVHFVCYCSFARTQTDVSTRASAQTCADSVTVKGGKRESAYVVVVVTNQRMKHTYEHGAVAPPSPLSRVFLRLPSFPTPRARSASLAISARHSITTPSAPAWRVYMQQPRHLRYACHTVGECYTSSIDNHTPQVRTLRHKQTFL